MTPEQWQKAREVLADALDLKPEDRQAFLDRACSADHSLRREVERLLASTDLVRLSFLQSSAFRTGLSPGAKLGDYEVQGLIGSGGMGEVYRARDNRLGRDVAIKVLPAFLSHDPDRLRRFEQEARAAAALNHPNILAVHQMGSYEGAPYLVSELLEGTTLREQSLRGPLPVRKVIDYGVQIARGLAAAHEKGITHRDLKPENLFVTKDGRVKILDFGLAKLTQQKTVSAESAPTVGAQTEPGVVMGTVGYMAPEQVRGSAADHRTDIFAFGAILYEILTGKRAFQKPTSPETMCAILNEDPQSISQIVPSIPPSLQRVVHRCLEKNPEQRFQSASDLVFALESLSDSGLLSTPQNDRKRSSRRNLVLVGIAAVALLLAATVMWFRSHPISRSTAPTFTRLTDEAGPELYPSLSPDNRFFVYQSRASGKWDIYFQRVGGKNPVNLTKDSADDNTQPALSPDGERVVFRSERDGGGIFLMGATGEDVRRLAKFCYNPAWAPDRQEIVCSTGWFWRAEDTGTSHNGQLFRINISTGQSRPIPGKIEDARQPSWSPNGYRVAYWGRRQAAQRDIWTVAASGGDPVAVTNDPYMDWNPVWSPDGRYLYFSSDRGGSMNLWRVRIEETTGKTLASPEPVTTPSQWSGFISFTRDGLHLAYVQQTRTWNLYKAVLDPAKETIVGQPVSITQGSKEAVFPDVSPDGKWIAFTSRQVPEDVYVVKTDGTGLRQLTDDIYLKREPRWSPDGKRIAFFSNRTGKWQIWAIRPDGSSLEQLTNAAEGANGPIWSPDGTRLFCFAPVGQPFVLETNKAWSERSYQELPPESESGGKLWAWSWSADGKRLVGPLLRREDGSTLGLTAYSLDSKKYERLTPFGMGGHWLSDNRRVLFTHQGKIYLVDSMSKKLHEVLSVAPHEVVPQFGFFRDRLIVFTLDATQANIWQMDLGQSRHTVQ
jgi:serine/threonine protein kinase